MSDMLVRYALACRDVKQSVSRDHWEYHRLHAGGVSVSTYPRPQSLRRAAKPREVINAALVGKN